MTTAYTQPRNVKGSHNFVCGRDRNNPVTISHLMKVAKKKGGYHYRRDQWGRLAICNDQMGILHCSKKFRMNPETGLYSGQVTDCEIVKVVR